MAAHLAKADDKIHAGKTTIPAVARSALRSLRDLEKQSLSMEEKCSHTYELFADGSSVSKAVAAQYLACILDRSFRKGTLDAEVLSQCLPKYLIEAIDHVTYIPDAMDAVASSD